LPTWSPLTTLWNCCTADTSGHSLLELSGFR